jgi:uncharacterized alpha-E superfamily protein
MISRVADHCFWLGRYVERAEQHGARPRGHARRLALDAELTPQESWAPVIIVFGEEAAFVEKHGEADAREMATIVQRYMTWDGTENRREHPRSVGAARENARSMREVVSLEVWEIINELYLYVNGDDGRREYEQSPWAFYRNVRKLCAARASASPRARCSTTRRSTSSGSAWSSSARARRRAPRRPLTTRFTTLTNKHEVMRPRCGSRCCAACSGFEPFMKRHRGAVTGSAVAAFLLLEPSFPRSVRTAIDEAYERLASIRPPEDAGFPGAAPLERARALDAWVASLDPESLLPAYVHMVLTRVVDDAALVCEGIAEEFFGRPAAV